MNVKNFFRLPIKNESLWIKSICSALIISILLSFLPFAASCEELSDNVFRLHVLANSDSEEDQAVKLLVRDSVLLETQKWYQGADSFEETNFAICTNLQSIQAAAQTALLANGSDDKVVVKVTEKYFTTRDYENFSLPAGKYRTLQVEIGEAKGKNWWCMVYPALCIPAAQKSNEKNLDEMPENEKEIITNPDSFQVKFKIVEWFEGLKSMLDS